MSPLGSWTLIAVGAVLIWLVVSLINERAARRNAERALGEVALRNAEANVEPGMIHIQIQDRSGLRRRTLRLDEMTPEQFRQALAEIEQEGRL